MSDLEFDLQKVPEKYRLSDNPQEEIIAFRGDISALEISGLLSHALKAQDYERVGWAKRIIESGDEQCIQEIVDKHTDCSKGCRLMPKGSPFVSGTINPQIAQFFARRKNETIYQIKINAQRAIRDINPKGRPTHEILILGMIKPEEITAVKIDNEYLSPRNEYFDAVNRAIPYLPEFNHLVTQVREPENWREI
jgi:hypothetical protein